MINKGMISGVMLSLSICSVSADDSAKTVKNETNQRTTENGFGIVPMPYEVKAGEGNPFVITKETVIIVRSEETKNCATYLQQRLRKSCGLTLRRRGATDGAAIVLMVSDDAHAFSENDAYRLESSAEKITISAKTESGLFYGVQSLLQLLPPAVYGDKPQAGLELKVPALSINDKPSMDGIRGLHVDISRHFRTKKELLKIIESMAMHKLNTMHLHLSDVQGWRVEIKAFPKLTTIGAIGNKTDPKAAAKFLTQEEVKEIVAYAASRYISIIPEFDMPGHMGAAIRAYPELKHPKDERDPAKVIRGDAVARDFAKKVLTEIDSLFNSAHIHIGFDEVNHGSKVKLYTSAELIDFAQEMTTFVKEELKKTPIVWDDIFLEGFDDKETVVQWWRYGKEYWWKKIPLTADEALNQRQQPFILSPAYWTYFDMMNEGNGGWAKRISPAEMYNWDPYGDMLGKTEHTRSLVRGAIACTWSERIPTMKVFGDRTYPRLAGFSERIWRGGKLEAPNILSWPDYRDQVLIPFQLKRYDALGLHYWSKDRPEQLSKLEDQKKTLQIKKPVKRRVAPKAGD
ncbi:beta-N-acetylhexosaminidase [Akkermansiaceae bacterium]|nr:beta-N-acetylhexosaminidase [bacterium]MDB4319350.1 beta-N-acetylhexosaminidase [bacterium]MDB4532315.1 beta-N-acetylhexosaminidase [bacterium]MDB4630427.1 beta-N-acetylhexosaminidase [Akkermansiaceae bacterium]MDB4699851.1 beta-N-acetylhexosaminidase [Akkermansiaceae bacterium]